MNLFIKAISNKKNHKILKIFSKLSNKLLKNINNKKFTTCFKILKFISYTVLFIVGCSFLFLVIHALIIHSSVGSSVKLGQKIYLTSPKNVPVERTIDIVMSADDGYIQHSAATMASILLNCDASSSFRFHILDGGISSDKKEKLLNLKKLRDFKIKFYGMSKYDWSIFPDNRRHTTLATYYRLRIPEVLSGNIQKVLYLDGDIIVEQDLKELWDTDISNYILGAVEDVEGIDSKRRLSLAYKYFNAGVLLLDLNQLRQSNLLKNSIEYLKKHRAKIIYQDQDILNGLFNAQYKDLPLKWNVNSYMYIKTDRLHTYTDHDKKITKNNPAIIHFTGGSLLKPWIQEMLHPLSDEYWNYYKCTGFYSPDQRKHPIVQMVSMYVAIVKYLFSIMLN